MKFPHFTGDGVSARPVTVNRRGSLVLLLAAALFLAACGGANAETATSQPNVDAAAPQAATEPEAPEGVAEPDAAPEVVAEPDAPPALLSGTFETLDGDTIDLGSLEGQDVVLWFWAPW